MKKSIKKLITVFAVCAVSAFAVVASGCNLADKIKEKIEQARCEHEWNDGEVTKEATCTEKGELTKTCTLCEKVETEEIEFAEHIAVYVQAVTPTCLEKGVTDGTVCSVCETKISGFQEIPALGHIVVKDSAVKPTCLEGGLTEGEHCSRCNEVLKAQEKAPATGHNLVILEAVEPTCTTEGKAQGVWCDKCEVVFKAQEIIPALGHFDDDDNSICDGCGIPYVLQLDEIEVGMDLTGYKIRLKVSEEEFKQFVLSEEYLSTKFNIQFENNKYLPAIGSIPYSLYLSHSDGILFANGIDIENFFLWLEGGIDESLFLLSESSFIPDFVGRVAKCDLSDFSEYLEFYLPIELNNN